MRIIMLVDMDYFFVACEELRNKEIIGKPTVVGFDPKQGKGRGVVMTCNYEARKYGIRSGMPISMAYRLKPDAIYLPLDYDWYEKVSKDVMSVIKEHAAKFEQVSVDEAFIDVSDKVSDFDDARIYARRLKDNIKNRIGLPCTIGVSYNKLLAKMACESAKPDGIGVVAESEAKAFLENKSTDDLYGVGRKTKERLEAMGFKTVGELAKANPMDMMENFGAFGIELHDYANGIDNSEVNENYEIKSIGREHTFEKDTSSEKDAIEAIDRLSKEVIEEVKKNGFAFKVITLKIRYSDFSEHLRSRSIRYSNDIKDVMTISAQLYRDNVEKDRKVRKIGVRVSGFIKRKGQKSMEDFAR
ncbi:MAG: DNA polymerase IV [Candidatus Micrarchaeota archaeon]|nr:DNA polymerase IV [Candidatus Micrarchaeota archaeon]MDE1823924.1 DNA polymerase IV [Candidatus Micrarchaeota archaeon]MDE1849928.1 DNA polymerase IV [Candidatus Micrarchaeota archaeon]